ncbi:polysaccharide biosynthesis tyrosine autokinase [Thermodesulfobacteriota bacterium]
MGKIADGLAKAKANSHSREENTSSTASEQIAIPSSSSKAGMKSSARPAARPYAASSKWDERLAKAANDDPHLPEIFKSLRARILHPLDKRPRPKSVIVLSAAASEGKSFITANLGISLAQSLNQYCLMVDCDLRRPTLSALFGLENNFGLADCLQEERNLDELLIGTSLATLSVLPSGKPPSNPAELLGSSRMRSLVIELSDRYADRIILFDCPPTLAASETLVLANQMDAVIVVVREGGAKKAQIQKLIDSIDSDRLLGIVFNGHTTNIIERRLIDTYSGYYY